MLHEEKAKAYLELAVQSFLSGDVATSFDLFMEGMTSYTEAANEQANVPSPKIADLVAASLSETVEEVSEILPLEDRFQALVNG